MVKEKTLTDAWNKLYGEITELENTLIRFQPAVDALKEKELTHLIQIATGNVRKVRAWVIQNQGKIIYRLRVAKSHKKGGTDND